MRYYAILNQDSICYGVISTEGIIEKNVVEIEFDDTGLIGKQYEDGTFKEIIVENPEVVPDEESVLDIIDAMLGSDEDD